MPEKLNHPRIISKLINEPWLIQEDYLVKMIEIAKGYGDVGAVETKRSLPLEQTAQAFVRDGVAHIPIMGPIFPRANIFTEISGGVSISTLAKDFQVALENPEVSSIILDIDSPGGAVTGTNEMADIIRAASAQKDVTAYVSGTAASGGYWLASSAPEVVIDATARVGGIGVVVAYPGKSDDDTVEIWNSASPNKRIDISTDEGKKVVLDELNAIAEVFIGSVATFRGVLPEKVISSFGKGSVLVGQNAVDVGMADRLGSFESLLAEKSILNVNEGGFIMAEGKIEITADSLKTSDPDVFESIKTLGREEGVASAKKVVDSKDSEITGLKEKITSQDNRLITLEKVEVLRTEREMKSVAGATVSAALAASTIPTRLHERIRATLGHGKFVVDGQLDNKAYSEHVAAEVKDWEDNLMQDSVVQGFGSTNQTPVEGSTPTNVDEIVTRMAASAGQTIQ